MRHLLVCLTVAALAGPVLAGVSPETAVIDIKTAGAVLNGDHWEIAAPLAAPFFVDIFVSCSDPEGMSSFQVQLTGPEGLCYASSAKGGGYNPMTWDPMYGLPWSAGCFPPGPIVGVVYEPGWPGPYGVNGLAASVKMTSGTAPVGSTFDGINPSIGDHNGDIVPESNITVRPLLITPEPVSALLLLASLPMLRRRR